MIDQRQKDMIWNVTNEDGLCISVDHANLAVLMDIRDELKKLNSLLHCPNFAAVPFKLDRIARNTSKPKRKAAKRTKKE